MKINFKKNHLYLYVEPCPRCQCEATGLTLIGDVERVKESIRFAKHGIITRTISKRGMEKYPYNFFCTYCKYEWNGRPKCKLLTKKELEEQKELRDTYNLTKMYKTILAKSRFNDDDNNED